VRERDGRLTFRQSLHRQLVGRFHSVLLPPRTRSTRCKIDPPSSRSHGTTAGQAMKIKLLSLDFDGTLVSHVSEPVLDERCMQLIRDLQGDGVLFAINTGRSVDLLESGLTDFEFPMRPDFILTTEREVFRPGGNGEKWEPFGDWNARCARDHAELFSSAQSILAEVVDFVTHKTKAQLLYHSQGLEGLRAESPEEMDRIVEFIELAGAKEPKFN